MVNKLSSLSPERAGPGALLSIGSHFTFLHQSSIDSKDHPPWSSCVAHQPTLVTGLGTSLIRRWRVAQDFLQLMAAFIVKGSEWKATGVHLRRCISPPSCQEGHPLGHPNSPSLSVTTDCSKPLNAGSNVWLWSWNWNSTPGYSFCQSCAWSLSFSVWLSKGPPDSACFRHFWSQSIPWQVW